MAKRTDPHRRAEILVDKAMELDHLGGTYGGCRKPTPFFWLLMRWTTSSSSSSRTNEDYKWTLEASRTLEPRRSALEDDFGDEEEKEEENQVMDTVETDAYVKVENLRFLFL